MSTATDARPFTMPGLHANGMIARTIRLSDFDDIELRVAADGTLREFDGIAVPYNREIDVDGWLYEEWQGSAASGPFDKQMRAANRIKVAYNHIFDGGDLIGKLRNMSNDARGLRITGKVTEGVPAGDSALALMADKALDELSIGFFRVPDGDSITRDRDGRPHIMMTQARLFEVALVPFGAYGRGATISGTRSAAAGQAEQRGRVQIMLDGVEIASYRLADLAGQAEQRSVEPVDEPEPTPDPEPIVDALPSVMPWER